MQRAYAVGEALARLAGWRQGLAVLVDLPGPEAVAFAAGAADVFEPVLLLDNWPHPHGVVPSHLTLAALAYYQPRFASQKERVVSAPLFVLDRARLTAFSEETDRFDNRYYARMPRLRRWRRKASALSFTSCPRRARCPNRRPQRRPAAGARGWRRRGAGRRRPGHVLDRLRQRSARGARPAPLRWLRRTDAAFWDDYSFGTRSRPRGRRATSSATRDYRFVPRAPAARPANLGTVAVVAAASGLVLAAALDRRGSMNRFAGRLEWLRDPCEGR